MTRSSSALNKFAQLYRNSRPSRLIGLDLGSVTIGVAISDNTWLGPVQDVGSVKRKDFDKEFPSLLKNGGFDIKMVAGYVIGMPYDKISGKASAQSKKYFNWLKELRTLDGAAMIFEDERFTTSTVRWNIRHSNYASFAATKDPKKIAAMYLGQKDSLSAKLILEQFQSRLLYFLDSTS